MRTHIFLLIAMFWLLGMQAFANEQVTNGRSGAAYSGSSGVATDKDQEVALAKACIAESKQKNKTAWAKHFMALRQKWISTELACAPKMVMSTGANPYQYAAGNGQYEQFLKTHHNLIMEAQRAANPEEAGEAASASKYRSEITAANCQEKMPEYYRAMTYNGDELEWHIAYELKQNKICDKGPSKPPIILEERSEKIRIATQGFSKNRGVASTYVPTGTSATVQRSDLPLLSANAGTCEKPNYEDVATKFLNTNAWMFGYAGRCVNTSGDPQIVASWHKYQNMQRALDKQLKVAYESYMKSQNRAPKQLFGEGRQEGVADVYTVNARTSHADTPTHCAAEKNTFNQIANLTPTDYLGRLKSSSCTDSTTRQASNVPTS